MRRAVHALSPCLRLWQGSLQRRSTQRAAMTDLAPAQLWSRVKQSYTAAQESGAASKMETHIHARQDGGITFVIREAASLQSKPKPQAGAEGAKPANPFLPYSEDLWVCHLSDTHTLLLNKFNVVEHHLLVVTRAFESQLDSLTAADLAATLKVLQALPGGGLAFFNCGEQSGASQPHKHIQVVPLPLGPAPAPPLPLRAVMDQALRAASAQPGVAVPLRQLPCISFCARLPPRAKAEHLNTAYRALMEAAGLDLQQPSASYNFWCTEELALLALRSQEKDGPCSINALGYAGTVLVKSQSDLQYVLDKGPLAILRHVGAPWDQYEG